MMKILWFSNKAFSDKDDCSSGTWLGALAKNLVATGQVELFNITIGNVEVPIKQDAGAIHQWIIPISKSRRDGLPPSHIIAELVGIVKDVSPDLVHIWGTESYWGLLSARNLIQQPVLLETQGLKFAIAKVFHGGLTFSEQISSIGLKELLRRSTIYQARKSFEEWGIFEKEMLSRHRFITVQTDWLEAQVRQYNDTCEIFRNDFVLREEFYSSEKWRHSANPTIFCTAAYSAPFKGLHVAVRAVSILKKRLPAIRLRIAGAHQRKGFRQDGYISWVNQEISRLGIDNHVTWLGPLSAPQIIAELLECAAVVIPSFVEGYCLGLAEALMIGTPAVAAFSGGIPCIAKNDESALFFPPGDEAMCAYQLRKVLSDRKLAESLSQEGIKIAERRNDWSKVVKKQLEIYRQVLSEILLGTSHKLSSH